MGSSFHEFQTTDSPELSETLVGAFLLSGRYPDAGRRELFVLTHAKRGSLAGDTSVGGTVLLPISVKIAMIRVNGACTVCR